jgi:cyclohexyl-isocyanide hydratase
MAQASSTPLVVGMLLFPNMTILDLTGPYDVFTRMPGARIHLIAARLGPIRTEKGLIIAADTTFDAAPPFDLLFVPGGPGQQEVMEDEPTLAFLREQGRSARLVTSVCTGSLILGAAGLLQGYRATTHWRYLDLLALLGAQPVAERVVVDRNRITGAGVSAGIDLALVIASALYGERIAQTIQLGIEYDPQPPFHSGSPRSADAALLEDVAVSLDGRYEQRRRQIERIIMKFPNQDR